MLVKVLLINYKYVFIVSLNLLRVLSLITISVLLMLGLLLGADVL